MIEITSDWSDVDRELDRLDRLPGPKAKKILDGVLDFAKLKVQAVTHVETGSLKSSEKTSSEEKFKTWVGTLEVGGASTGVNNPVDYAIYEKRRGGAHDFMLPVEGPEMDSEWIKGLLEVLSG